MEQYNFDMGNFEGDWAMTQQCGSLSCAKQQSRCCGTVLKLFQKNC